jgi:hypothetical protein
LNSAYQVCYFNMTLETFKEEADFLC